MNLPSLARLKALSATPSALLAFSNAVGGVFAPAAAGFSGGGFYSFPKSPYVDGYFFATQSATYAMMWETQLEVRSVVGMLAQNFMQVPLGLFDIDLESDEVTPDPLHPAMQALRNPYDRIGMGQLLEGLASDYLVFDNAYLLKIGDKRLERPLLLRIPPYAVGIRGPNKLVPSGYRITYADNTYDDFSVNDIIHIPGYNALDPRVGVSRMETLRQTLIDSATRRAASIEFNRSGRLKGGVIERPLDAPALNDTGREAIESSVASKLRGTSSNRVVMLDEGMTWEDAGVDPRAADVLRTTQLGFAEVCHAFGLHPDVMGVWQLSPSMVEARKQEYMDVLPPIGDRMAEAFRVQFLETDYAVRPGTKQFRFDWEKKLEGDPVERIIRATTAAGRPVVTVNEVRARLGYPAVEDQNGDELVIPTNVIAAGGGLPAPNVMPIPNPNTPAQDGSHREGDPNVAKMQEESGIRTKSLRVGAMIKRSREYHAEHEILFREYFARQERSLARGGKADSLRWDQELADDLLALARKSVQREGEIIGAHLMGEFDLGSMENYLAAGARNFATAINKSTANQLARGGTLEDVFTHAKNGRANSLGRTRATELTNFAAVEAGQQNPARAGQMRLKTWVTMSEDSRHKRLNQETVMINSPFSDGSRFPGDPKMGKDHNINCGCLVHVY